MNRHLAAPAMVVSVLAAATGTFATPANSHGNAPDFCFANQFPDSCRVYLTGAGPSPSTLEMHAGQVVTFFNTDSVTHTVVFANGLCSVTLAPGQGGYGGGFCSSRFTSLVGSYPYTVDGKFPGTVVTAPWPRSVTLTARTHTIRGGARLTLHGQVTRSNTGAAPPPPVIVLARRSSQQPFKPVATVRTRGAHKAVYAWKLEVQPGATTTYLAEVTTQRPCYFPASRCAHPQGQIWANAKSRPFTVRVSSPSNSARRSPERRG